MFFLDRIKFASLLPGSDHDEVILVWETESEMSRSSAEVAVAGFVEVSQQECWSLESGEYERALLKLTQRAERRRISSSTAVLKRAASRLGIPLSSSPVDNCALDMVYTSSGAFQPWGD